MDKDNARRTENNGVPIIGVSRHRLGADGNGVTTLIAFHGCNLRCKYCLNPEALSPNEDLPRYTPESLYEKVKVDDLYFRATGGGITFGGGEPCLQADFIVKFRELCGNDWKIRLETSLNAPYSNLVKLIPVIDEWIVDIKTDDREVYERYTGQPFVPVYQHLRGLMSQLGYNSDKLILRIPIIPGYTTRAMVEDTKRNFELSGISRFDLFTYRTERPRRIKSLIDGLTPGKAKCELLKALRKDLSNRYGIQYRERECNHEGDCPGTCPLCEAELESLTQQIKVIAPEKLEISDEIIELCQLNKSFSSDISPESGAPDDETIELNGKISQLDGDVEMPPIEGEILQPGLPEPPGFEYKKVFFKECPVAGLSFHLEKDDELWDELCEGTKIALVRDRKNKYDKNAVAVVLADDYDGDLDDFDFDFILGYIPRTENVEIAALMDAGYADKFEAEITTYHRHGNYNDRIRITIFILSNEPEIVRPDLLRAQSISYSELREMVDELYERGTTYFRWGGFNGFPPDELQFPIEGEKIVIVHRDEDSEILYLMRVLATGDECAKYVENPDSIHCVDDCAPYILTNVMGPIRVKKSDCPFLSGVDLCRFSATDYLPMKLSAGFKGIFKKQLFRTINRNNIDMDPSIDETID